MCASRPKKRAIRKTKFLRDSDSEEEVTKEKPEEPHKSKQENIPSTHELVETIKCWQNMRKRPPGVSAEALLTGRKVELSVAADDDPFKMKAGGLVDMKGAFRKPLGDEFEDEVRLSKTFAAETNKRDEDADMYVQFCCLIS
ncbi:unnamed protein product [Schistocephalus solidus]|uniref:Nucleophosmin n=1 Tax=Schistocephalus solidus TaxID=70667 RepID=A0A183TUC3_SCHSO|nr:unnamed protein product [Schistocephalus solidus]